MPSTTPLAFGIFLKQLRRQAGMTQHDLAAAVGYSDSLISSLEKAQRLPDLAAVTSLFVPALGLQDDPASAARLVELAAVARGERPPVSAVFQRVTRAELREEAHEQRPPLPLPPTPLLGRVEEIEQLCNRLLGHTGRLLTLVGPPGIGKTRLALAVAERLRHHYSDGAVFVPLAAISEPMLMAASILAAVGNDEESARPPTERLMAALRPKHLLLVLDNCEQIIGAGPLVAELLAACPELRILATSRERLHLRAEQRYRVPPLDLGAAVTLFTERACAVEADFALSPANRPTVEAICQRLDRLPLALELCAAQVDLLAPQQILMQLQVSPLDLLENGAHDLPPQHRTLRNAIQRSYELLAGEERTLFRSLGVFVGGCDLAALEAVSAWQEGEHVRSLLSTLHALIGKNLVRVEMMPTGEQRFTMLETIREYALERLRAQGEEPTLRERHYGAYLHFTRTADRYLRTPESAHWLQRLKREQENIRAALQWAFDEQRYADAAWLIVAVQWFWFLIGQWYDTGGWLALLVPHQLKLDTDLRLAVLITFHSVAHAVEALQPVEPWTAEMLQLLEASSNMHLHAAAWHFVATFALDFPQMAAARERAIDCARAGPPEGVDARFCLIDDHDFQLGTNLCIYADALIARGAFTQALPLLLECCDIFEKRGSRYELVDSLETLGLLALLQGNLPQARAYLHEAVTIAAAFTYQEALAISQPLLGVVALRLGNAAEARKLISESLKVCGDLKSPGLLARAYSFLADVALCEGQLGEAEWCLAESLRLYTETGNITIYTVQQAYVAARLAAARHQYECAARLFGVAEQANRQIHDVFAGPLRSPADDALTTVRVALSPEAFSAAFAAGQQLSLDQAFSL